MSRIERPDFGYAARDIVKDFTVKYAADELALAVTVDQIVELMYNGSEGLPLMLVANEAYTVANLVSQVKEVIALAVETGRVPLTTADHMVISQTDDGEGAIAIELIAYDPNRRASRALKAADAKRVKAGKALGTGKAVDARSTGISTKYAGILAEAKLRQNGTLADILGDRDEERVPVTA